VIAVNGHLITEAKSLFIEPKQAAVGPYDLRDWESVLIFLIIKKKALMIHRIKTRESDTSIIIEISDLL
jgi:hypothetical protein